MNSEKSILLQTEQVGEMAWSMLKNADAFKNSHEPMLGTCAPKEKRRKTQTLSEMTNQQLEEYKHSPETELADQVCDACSTKDFSYLGEYLETLFAVDPAAVNQVDSAGMTALHFAVSCRNVQCLSAKRDDSNKKMGRYPSKDVTKFLLAHSKDSDVNRQTNTGATPLHGAALQGNRECIKLLLERGADPKQEDEDSTTPLELARNNETKSMLHMSLIQSDVKRDIIDATCVQCKQIPTEGLKRCGACHVTMYCGKSCQIRHWREGGHKKNCPGSVIARPFRVGEDPNQNCVQVSFYRVLGSNKPNVKVFKRAAKDSIRRMNFMAKKRFVVKVQLPLNVIGKTEMMAYNADRSVEGYVHPDEPGYDNLQRKIYINGYRGIKAFFWAELTNKNDGTFRIFGGKCAPYQTW